MVRSRRVTPVTELETSQVSNAGRAFSQDRDRGGRGGGTGSRFPLCVPLGLGVEHNPTASWMAAALAAPHRRGHSLPGGGQPGGARGEAAGPYESVHFSVTGEDGAVKYKTRGRGCSGSPRRREAPCTATEGGRSAVRLGTRTAGGVAVQGAWHLQAERGPTAAQGHRVCSSAEMSSAIKRPAYTPRCTHPSSRR